MYKIIAVDLDGTLLNSYGELTIKTKRILKNAKRKGIEVVIASGRSIDSIKSIAEEIDSSKYIIAGNGAVIYDRIEEKNIYENFIPKEKVIEIIKLCDENNIFYNVYTDKAIIASSLRFNVLYYYKENLNKEEKKKTHIVLVENIENYVKQMQNESVMKVLICDSDKSVFNSIMRRISLVKDVEVLNLSYMSRKTIRRGTEQISIQYYYTEISMKNVDKWYALEFLLNKLKVEKTELIAIGDNWNDRKMIQEAGVGVTMKDSNTELVEIADMVADSNNNDGVAKILEFIIGDVSF